ncbi:acyltransferase family protein [Microbacterium sp. No. 7]|uniref:acyltransferase family protein n=1 Tax=Microbacterium sp. No. 7 TaxID=1714373 RepID=UPI0009E96DB7|nr:acyltransferase family protein [Microbacterium sp. No. 7]
MPTQASTVKAAAADRSHFRLDMQGLRAVAVLVVFADHMFGWPAGGFLGVDVFFVISGFLITGLLLREYERTGHISFRAFYTGRLKRIVPSATVVLLLTVAFSHALFTAQRATSITWDALWAFLFGANWNFAIAGTDYFQQGGAVSPLQHYWSLSVEEQFYFVWPWLLLGLLVVFARFTTVTPVRARWIAGTAITIVSLASFAWALVQSATSPTVAYFSTFTRGWELGVGALIAIAAPLFTGIPARARTTLAYIGLGGIFASCLLITSETTWPAPWALLPVLATALVIVSGIGAQAPHLAPLTNRVSVFIGDISYSLYLWHFPVVVFGHALYPGAGPWVSLCIVAVGFALAVAQYYGVEKPLWKSPLGRRRARGSWASWRREHAGRIVHGLAAGCAVLLLVAMSVVFLPSPPPASVASAGSSVPAPSASPSDPAPALRTHATKVFDGLRTTSWPQELTPSVDEVGPDAKAKAWVDDGCLALGPGTDADPHETAERCVYGDPDAPRSALLAGDSMAISWLPALQGALGPDWSIRVVALQQCPFADVSVTKNDGSDHADCDDFHALTREIVRETEPDLIVLSQTDSTLRRLVDADDEAESASLVRRAAEDTISAFAASSERVIVLGAPQSIPDIAECYTRTAGPATCAGTIQDLHRTAAAQLARATASVDNATFVPADPFLCWHGDCPATIDGYVVMADGAHLTQQYSASLARVLQEALPPDIP